MVFEARLLNTYIIVLKSKINLVNLCNLKLWNENILSNRSVDFHDRCQLLLYIFIYCVSMF